MPNAAFSHAKWPAAQGRETAPADPVHPNGNEPASDLELVRRTLGGDLLAFQAIMRRNSTRLYRVARSVLKNEGDAEDAVQEGYLKAYERLAEFRGDSALSTWLVRIVLNEALGSLRRRRRSTAFAAAIERDGQAGQVVRLPGMTSSPDPEGAVATRQISRLIERAVDALPVKFRIVFVMRCVEEMSVEETAAQLGIPEATVKTRLHRARHLLRRALDEELSTTLTEAFPFAGARCARIAEAVLGRLASKTPLAPGPHASGASHDRALGERE